MPSNIPMRSSRARLALTGTLCCLSIAIVPSLASAQSGAPPQSSAFLRTRVDDAKNRLLLEIPAAQLDHDFIYQNVLATGLGTTGSGPSLDRGQLGQSVIVRLERHGARVLMVRDNWSVRAVGADVAGQRAAAEAFPRSVIASFPVDAERDGVITVDATSFFLSDAYGVADALRGGQGGGNYRVDASRSWIDTARTKSFARNAEVHAVLTFVSDVPAAALRRAAPDPKAVTFEEHHSLLALPERGYRPRDFDPRSGFFGTQFSDYAQPFEERYRGGYINRWRLVPRDTAAYLRGQLVEPVTPITYYLDPAIPAPYREALREGGNWWSRVFEAAGFRNAFRVLDLPAGADQMDARYNMIYWVHRSGPGPSVGPNASDPRTGEILHTVVRLDSWRSLIDYNIWAGMVPAAGPNGLNVSAEAFAMARRRQHAAHEIGHTLGLQHNYIASSQGRASVMDYPVPLITLRPDGTLDLRDAYRTGPGAWDTLAIRYGYTWFPDSASERRGLEAIVAEGISKGIRFINDAHAEASGSIPQVTRWVEGATMFDAIARTSKVRRLLIDKFDERAIQPGEPMHLLNMRFAHVYLHHRYSLEGLIKYVGGMDFTYAVRGDKQVPTRVLPASEQRRALGMALDALAPAELTVPERVIALIPPAPPGFDQQLSWIDGSGGTAFDPITLAGGLATEVVQGLLHPDRAARLVLFHSRDANALGLDEEIMTIVRRTWGATPPASNAERAVQRATQRAVLDVLLDLAGNKNALPDVRAIAFSHVQQLDRQLATHASTSAEERAHVAAARRDIARFIAGDDDPAARPRFPIITLPWP